jgi:DNA helicase-2/ATP-dependent DNA helicase PcrA
VNAAQHELLRLLRAQSLHGSLFIVGDLNQAIYGFRGADPDIMEATFLAEFPDCVTKTLKDNYRCAFDCADDSPEYINNVSQRFLQHLHQLGCLFLNSCQWLCLVAQVH